jgi:hypothetical protein
MYESAAMRIESEIRCASSYLRNYLDEYLGPSILFWPQITVRDCRLSRKYN